MSSKIFKQLCWDCQNIYKERGCPWADTFQYPQGVILNKDHFIIKCPLFKPEETNCRTIKSLCKEFGINERTYYRKRSKGIDLIKQKEAKYDNQRAAARAD